MTPPANPPDRKEIERAFRTLVLFVLIVILGANFYLIGKPTGEARAIEMSPAPTPFDGITLEARAAYILDITSGETVYEKNADEILPLASLTKIMTAITAADALDDATPIPISRAALAAEGSQGLFVGETWSPRELMRLTLVSSSNDGARALAEYFVEESFVQTMNRKSMELGLRKTYFFNATGLDLSRQTSGGYGTAKEIASLLSYGVSHYPDIFNPTRRRELTFASLSGVSHRVKNTNEGVESSFGVIASKTGYTALAGGNLAVVFDAGLQHPLAAIVLGSSPDGRFSDMETLMSAALAYAAE